jgi:hypothetical protein
MLKSRVVITGMGQMPGPRYGSPVKAGSALSENEACCYYPYFARPGLDGLFFA